MEIQQRFPPDPAAACLPQFPFTLGRPGRFPRQAAGIRTATPAASSSGTFLAALHRN